MRSYYGKLVQLPRLKALSALGHDGVGDQVVVNQYLLSSSLPGFGFIIALTQDRVIRVKTDDPVNSKDISSLLPVEAGVGNSLYKVGTVYAGQLWFLGPSLKLRSTDGSVVKEYGIRRFSGTISAVIPTVSRTLNITRFRTTQSLPGGLQNGLTVLVNPIASSSFGFSLGQLINFNSPSFPVYSRQYTITSIDIVGNSVFGISLGTVNGELIPSIDFVTATTATLSSVGQVQSGVGSLIGTFTSNSTIGAPFRVQIGDEVCLRGFQNNQFNGTFKILDVPTTKSFTFKLRANPGTTTDPNTGTFEFCNISDVPSARFITSWFDHLVVANCTFRGQYEPSKVRISDLYRPDVWTPTAENEADEFDMVISQSGKCDTTAITGLEKINDALFVYTPDCIYRLDYVGLPKVFQVRSVVEGYGNSFYNGLISNGTHHFFFDAKWKNFYQFDGSSLPISIGNDIVSYVESKIDLAESAIIDGWFSGFVNYDKTEITWTVTSSLSVKLRLTYNWVSKSWYVADGDTSGRNTLWPSGGYLPGMINDELATIDSFSLAYSVDNYDSIKGLKKNDLIYGSSNMFREAQVGDTGTILANPIILETKDYTTDLQRVVEIDRITIHADYITSSGIDVYVSARNSIQSFLNYKKVGTWTKNTPDGIVSFKPMHGRIFRYKFLPASDTDGLVFYSFTDNVFNTLAEK
jgi:hypothetical protein